MDWSLTMELSEILDRTADRLVADGTRAESRTLLAMAVAARELSPAQRRRSSTGTDRRSRAFARSGSCMGYCFANFQRTRGRTY